MGDWEFYRIPGNDDAPFHWVWRCRHQDGSVLTTPDTFRFFLDCVAHARLHGYCNGPLQTRREPLHAALPAVTVAPLQVTAARG
jgi:hypothetical protein